jgi:transposase
MPGAETIHPIKLNDVDPQAWLAHVLDKLVNLWPTSRIDDLMPWAWTTTRAAERLAG